MIVAQSGLNCNPWALKSLGNSGKRGRRDRPLPYRPHLVARRSHRNPAECGPVGRIPFAVVVDLAPLANWARILAAIIGHEFAGSTAITMRHSRKVCGSV